MKMRTNAKGKTTKPTRRKTIETTRQTPSQRRVKMISSSTPRQGTETIHWQRNGYGNEQTEEIDNEDKKNM